MMGRILVNMAWAIITPQCDLILDIVVLGLRADVTVIC